MTTLSPNQFALSPILGSLDLHFNTEVITSIIDMSASGSILYPGQAVKIVDDVGALPHVVPCTADADEVFGFIVYDRVHPSFTGGSRVEIAQSGSVMYLQATEAIARGVQVSLDYATLGGINSAAGNTGDDIVGYAIDKASTAGLIRVKLGVPSFKKV